VVLSGGSGGEGGGDQTVEGADSNVAHGGEGQADGAASKQLDSQGKVKGVVFCRDLSTGENWEQAVLELDLANATATVTQNKGVKLEGVGEAGESESAVPQKHKRRRSLTNFITMKKQPSAGDDSATDSATGDSTTADGTGSSAHSVEQQAAVKGVLVRGFVWITWDPSAGNTAASSSSDDSVPLPKSRFPAAMKLPLSPRIGGLKKLRDRMRTGSGGSSLATESAVPAENKRGGMVRSASDKDAISAAMHENDEEADREGSIDEEEGGGDEAATQEADGSSSAWKVAADSAEAGEGGGGDEGEEGGASEVVTGEGGEGGEGDNVQAHGFKMVIQHMQQVRRYCLVYVFACAS
jgi:hypothetical protein